MIAQAAGIGHGSLIRLLSPPYFKLYKELKSVLYGLVEPMTGESFFYEFCHLDSICFEKYLELFAQKFSKDFHVIQLDNGPLHQALDLAIPDNVAILFQPPYSPQVNSIERLWKAIKKELMS